MSKEKKKEEATKASQKLDSFELMVTG